MYLAFDVDGTLYDVGDIVAPCFHEGIELYIREKVPEKLVAPSREVIVQTLGLPMDEIFHRLFPELPYPERLILMDMCTSALVRGIRAEGGYLFSGVANTLRRLYEDGFHLLVASNGRLEYVRAILETWDLQKYFSGPLILPGGDIPDKTGVIKRYLQSIPHGEQLIMIGDRFTDRDAALANGIPFIGCAFGHAGEDELQGASRIVHCFQEIPEAVKEIMDDIMTEKAV